MEIFVHLFCTEELESWSISDEILKLIMALWLIIKVISSYNSLLLHYQYCLQNGINSS